MKVNAAVLTALLAIGHRSATGGLSTPAEASRFAPDYDAIMSGLGSWRPQHGAVPTRNKAPVEVKLDRGWHLP
jgi:hypothetical protein